MVWNIILPFKAVEIHIHYQLIHEIHWISFQGHSKVSQKSLSERTIFYPAIIAISAQLSEHLAEDADDAIHAAAVMRFIIGVLVQQKDTKATPNKFYGPGFMDMLSTK